LNRFRAIVFPLHIYYSKFILHNAAITLFIFILNNHGTAGGGEGGGRQHTCIISSLALPYGRKEEEGGLRKILLYSNSKNKKAAPAPIKGAIAAINTDFCYSSRREIKRSIPSAVRKIISEAVLP